jgi:hypothetical protein
MLLHRATRESLGVDLKVRTTSLGRRGGWVPGGQCQALTAHRRWLGVGAVKQGNIVVVDEAHNLVDAINEMYSTQLTLRQVLAGVHSREWAPLMVMAVTMMLMMLMCRAFIHS